MVSALGGADALDKVEIVRVMHVSDDSKDRRRPLTPRPPTAVVPRGRCGRRVGLRTREPRDEPAILSGCSQQSPSRLARPVRALEKPNGLAAGRPCAPHPAAAPGTEWAAAHLAPGAR